MFYVYICEPLKILIKIAQSLVPLGLHSYSLTIIQIVFRTPYLYYMEFSKYCLSVLKFWTYISIACSGLLSKPPPKYLLLFDEGTFMLLKSEFNQYLIVGKIFNIVLYIVKAYFKPHVLST